MHAQLRLWRLEQRVQAQRWWLAQRVARRPRLELQHPMWLLSLLLCLEALAQLYRRAGLPDVAAEIDRVRMIRRSPSAGPDALISRYLKSFDVEHTRMGWLTGLLLGYPVWTTIARYHSGAFTVLDNQRAVVSDATASMTS